MPATRRQLLLSLAAVALPGAAAERVPPLPLRQWQLDNGLRVLDIAAPDSASVAVQLWYGVGARDDPTGRSGFAHLFEHLMFKRTRHMPDEMFDRLTEDVGGHNNAFTGADVTAYQSVVPPNHVERILWAEAERLAHLDVSQAAFYSERKVVEEEFRQSVLADPYGRFFEAFGEHGFVGPLYRRPVIGNIDELRAATLAEVRAFHARWYRPDNALLLVCGPHAPGALDAAVRRHFGPLRRPAEALQRDSAAEPRRTRSARIALRAPNVRLPAAALLWQGPPARSADAPALRIAAALLASGDASRFNDALVHRAQIAQSVGCSAELNALAGLISAHAVAAGSAQPALLEAGLLRQVERLARDGPSAAELERVRARLLTAALIERQRAQGRCEAVGWAVVLHGDAAQADADLAALQAVDAADVRRVLRRYLVDAPRVALGYARARA